MKALWDKIKRGAKTVGDFQARVILTILYALLVLPTGLITKIGGDLLESRYPGKAHSFWKPRPADNPALKPARRQG